MLKSVISASRYRHQIFEYVLKQEIWDNSALSQVRSQAKKKSLFIRSLMYLLYLYFGVDFIINLLIF